LQCVLGDIILDVVLSSSYIFLFCMLRKRGSIRLRPPRSGDEGEEEGPLGISSTPRPSRRRATAARKRRCTYGTARRPGEGGR